MEKPTKTKATILSVLNAAEGKVASWRDLKKASGCKTANGFRRVLHRMMQASQVAYVDQHGIDMTITFAGLQALQRVETK